MAKQQKITFLLNKIKESYEKINEHAKKPINIECALASFENVYNKLDEGHLDNVIKANGFHFYTTKSYKLVA